MKSAAIYAAGLFGLLSACAGYDGETLATDLACDAREARCVEQCRAGNPYDDRLVDCEMRCAPSEATACR